MSNLIAGRRVKFFRRRIGDIELFADELDEKPDENKTSDEEDWNVEAMFDGAG